MSIYYVGTTFAHNPPNSPVWCSWKTNHNNEIRKKMWSNLPIRVILALFLSTLTESDWNFLVNFLLFFLLDEIWFEVIFSTLKTYLLPSLLNRVFSIVTLIKAPALHRQPLCGKLTFLPPTLDYHPQPSSVKLKWNDWRWDFCSCCYCCCFTHTQVECYVICMRYSSPSEPKRLEEGRKFSCGPVENFALLPGGWRSSCVLGDL